MPRVARGDLLADLELPAHFRCTYEESGALLAVDGSNRFALRASGVTIVGEDPTARNLCVRNVIDGAAEKGAACIGLSESLVYYQYETLGETDGQSSVNEFWIVGFGNREVILTLFYFESDQLLLDLGGLRATIEAAIRSLRLTYPEKPRAGDFPDIFDFAESQRLWFDHRRSDIATRVRKLTGYDGDGLIPLDVLDDYWSRFVAAPPSDRMAIDAILNGVAVVFGDHLVQEKAFEWAIVSDSYGVCLAVVALRGKADLTTDPFNFVAKRWQRKEATFLVEGFRGICQFADDTLGKWIADHPNESDSRSPRP